MTASFFCFLFGGILFPLQLALQPEFHGNVKITSVPQRLKEFQAASIQNCLHRCQLHEKCSVINYNVIAGLQYNCIFYDADVIPQLNSIRSSPSMSWHLYALSKATNEKPSSPNSNTPTPPMSVATTAITPNDNLCDSDQFKISQVGTSNCLYETGGKIVLDNRCDDFFCENRLGYLMHVKKSECLRTSKVVKLNIDCSTIDADFTLNSNVSSNIWFRYSSGSPNCLVDNRKSIGLSSNPDDCIQVEKSSG